MERLRFALFGHPVRHSLSPAMHGAAIREMSLPHGYSAIDVPSEASLRRLVGEVRRGAFHGANITIPYKRAVLDMVDDIAPSAAEVGAANVLCRGKDGKVVAHNTDADALAAELGALSAKRDPAKLAGRSLRAVILGAGGAGLAAIVACQRIGCKLVAVTTRSWGGTEAVYESDAGQRARAKGALTTPWPSEGPVQAASGKTSQVLRMQWSEFAATTDVVVQATSAGMLGGDSGEEVALIVPWNAIPLDAIAYDVVYVPPVTPFLREARARGLQTSGGLGMLVRQAALSLSLWIGTSPSLDVMRAAAERALEGT